MSSTLANMQHGAQVDLARLNNIDFDQDSGSLTIGPGVKFSDVIDMLYSSGYQFRECPENPLMICLQD